MIEVLPIKLLRDEDVAIFGSLNVALGKLQRAGLPVIDGIVVTPPDIRLKTNLEHFDLRSEQAPGSASKEIFQQTLTLVKKEIEKAPMPKGVPNKHIWVSLLNIWVEEIKGRLWKDGFTKGLTEGLEPQLVMFNKKLKAEGKAWEDKIEDDVVIEVEKGRLEPLEFKKIEEVVRSANKKLFLPHSYKWVLDSGIKLSGVLPYSEADIQMPITFMEPPVEPSFRPKSAVKVFLDASTSTIQGEVEGIYIISEKIFDLNKPRDSFDDLVIKIVDAASSFPEIPILVKLADKSEGMGKVRGALRLIHQQSLFEPLISAIDFARHKKGLNNVHIVIPFVRTVAELAQVKRELSVKKLMRKHSLEQWMEVAIPENLINLEQYLENGVDGVVLNLDELMAYLNGFDHTQEDLLFYKNEVSGLLKFLEDSLKLLHKSKVPFIVSGSLSLYPQVLEFLIEKGVYGIVIENYEAPSIKDLLHKVEKRVILRRSV